jgi:type I restriction enzyme S subunit
MPDKDEKGWRSWRFDQMAIMVNDRIDNPAEANVEHYVGLEHLDADSLSIRRWGTPSDVEATKLRFRIGDIIFGRRRAYQRKLAVAHFDGICSAHAMVLRARSEVALPEFLPFFMQSNLFMERAKQISVGSLSPTINWKTLAKEEFALPPIEEQRRIAEALRAADALMGACDITRRRTRQLCQSLLGQEFDTEGTFQEKLSEHYSIVSGQVDPRESTYAGLPLVGPNHIESRTGRLLRVETAKAQSAISGKYLFLAGSVLYSKIRPNLAKATIAPFRGLCSADMYALVPKPTLNNEYLLGILLSDRFTRFAVSGSMRTGIPKLNRGQLEQYKCQIPDLNSQEEYVAAIRGINSAIERTSQYEKALIGIRSLILEGLAHVL